MGIGIMIGVVTFTSSVLGAYFTGQIKSNDRIARIEGRASVLEAGDEHLQAWLERIESKLDEVIKAR